MYVDFPEAIIGHDCIRKKYFCLNLYLASALFHTSVLRLPYAAQIN